MLTPMSAFVMPMNIALYRLYAIGGQNSTGGMRDVESFDPHTNRWTQVEPMQKRRGHVAVAVCHGFIYAIGGHDSPRTSKDACRHDDGERYDPRTNQWTLITSFSRPKEALGIAVVGNRLFIAGGYDGQSADDMETYDTESNQWDKVTRSTSVERHDHVCLLVFIVEK
jgi:kelch-like protein 1/4/5